VKLSILASKRVYFSLKTTSIHTIKNKKINGVAVIYCSGSQVKLRSGIAGPVFMTAAGRVR
ncbi:MAG: hypothetical protein Q8O55_07685, partial [Dehalococcoidales bacterium]|nr:hypothetical protein [Dehalococcoidales bacterium]